MNKCISGNTIACRLVSDIALVIVIHVPVFNPSHFHNVTIFNSCHSPLR